MTSRPAPRIVPSPQAAPSRTASAIQGPTPSDATATSDVLECRA